MAPSYAANIIMIASLYRIGKKSKTESHHETLLYMYKHINFQNKQKVF